MPNKYQKDMIRFTIKYPDWQSYNDDKITVNTVCSLVNLGIIEINEYSQMRIKSLLKARDFLGEYYESLFK